MGLQQNIQTGKYREPETGRNVVVTQVNAVPQGPGKWAGTVNYIYENEGVPLSMDYNEFAQAGKFAPYNPAPPGTSFFMPPTPETTPSGGPSHDPTSRGAPHSSNNDDNKGALAAGAPVGPMKPGLAEEKADADRKANEERAENDKKAAAAREEADKVKAEEDQKKAEADQSPVNLQGTPAPKDPVADTAAASVSNPPVGSTQTPAPGGGERPPGKSQPDSGQQPIEPARAKDEKPGPGPGESPKGDQSPAGKAASQAGEPAKPVGQAAQQQGGDKPAQGTPSGGDKPAQQSAPVVHVPPANAPANVPPAGGKPPGNK